MDAKERRWRWLVLWLGIFLLLLGWGIINDNTYWGYLFSDKQSLRLLTYVVADREIHDVSYYQPIDQPSEFSIQGVRGSYWVNSCRITTANERETYERLVKNIGAERVLRKGDLLICLNDTVGASQLLGFNPEDGPISPAVVRKAIYAKYLDDIDRDIYYMENHVWLLGLPDLVISSVKMALVRPLMYLAYESELIRQLISWLALIPGLTCITSLVFRLIRKPEGN